MKIVNGHNRKNVNAYILLSSTLYFENLCYFRVLLSLKRHSNAFSSLWSFRFTDPLASAWYAISVLLALLYLRCSNNIYSQFSRYRYPPLDLIFLQNEASLYQFFRYNSLFEGQPKKVIFLK